MHITLINPESFLYDGKVFYTNNGYMSRVSCSPKSTRLPYDHVKIGKACSMELFGRTFFSQPIFMDDISGCVESDLKDVVVKENSIIEIDGVEWHTSSSYLRISKAGFMSTRLPYDHVDGGKALSIQILGRTFFSPVVKKETE